MSWTASQLKRYDDEVVFQVGQFVEIDLPEIPIEDRECTWGVITGIITKYPLSPQLRKILYEIKLAGLYIKKSKRIFKGLKGELHCPAKCLTMKEIDA